MKAAGRDGERGAFSKTRRRPSDDLGFLRWLSVHQELAVAISGYNPFPILCINDVSTGGADNNMVYVAERCAEIVNYSVIIRETFKDIPYYRLTHDTFP